MAGCISVLVIISLFLILWFSPLKETQTLPSNVLKSLTSVKKEPGFSAEYYKNFY